MGAAWAGGLSALEESSTRLPIVVLFNQKRTDSHRSLAAGELEELPTAATATKHMESLDLERHRVLGP